MASEADIARAVEVLRSGKLLGLPTETVYGLGADASNELAVRSIFAAKGRPASHPLIVHLADVAQVGEWAAHAPPAAQALAARFWPGPLTLILKRSARALDVVTGGQDTVGLRVPAHALAREVLRRFGGGVAAPSANRFGRVSPTTAQHVRDELGGAVDFVLDGGPAQVGVESTIVDLSGPLPRLLRPGGVAREALEAALGGQRLEVVTEATDVRAPGLLASHYAPRAGLTLTSPDALAAAAARGVAAGLRVAVLSASPLALPAGAHHVTVPAEAADFARVLYGLLRRLDAEGYGLIVASLPPEEGLGLAVRDRLGRAAAPRG
jgi:L-threonylcarbamoyladenylate synthase